MATTSSRSRAAGIASGSNTCAQQPPACFAVPTACIDWLSTGGHCVQNHSTKDIVIRNVTAVYSEAAGCAIGSESERSNHVARATDPACYAVRTAAL